MPASRPFEYTHETVWKAAQLDLRIDENLELASPTAVGRACFRSALLSEEQGRVVLSMARDRSRLAGYAALMDGWLAALASPLRP